MVNNGLMIFKDVLVDPIRFFGPLSLSISGEARAVTSDHIFLF